MVYTFTHLALGLLVCYIIKTLFVSARQYIENRKFARAHGCKPPAQVPSYFGGINNFSRLLKAAKKGRHIQFVAKRYRTIGNTWKMTYLGTDVIGTIEPENLKAILATSFKDFSLGKFRHDNFLPFLGEGIFTLDGSGWEHSRALLRPQFSREQISDLDKLEVHVGSLIDCLPKEDGGVAELQQLFYRLTLDSATEFLFGESVGSLITPAKTTTGLSESSQDGKLGFAEAFNFSQNYVLYRSRFMGLYWLFNSRRFREANATAHRFVDHFVDLALHPEKRPVSDLEGGKNKGYVFLTALAEQTKDPKILRDQLLNILLAGRDTTASLLGWTFYLLARHPRVFNKLREEIIREFGTVKSGLGKKPTFSGLKDIAYLRWVLNEVSRLYPAVPVNRRVAVRNTLLPVGGGPDGRSPVFIPAGQKVDYSVYALHRRPDLYGEDAEEFRPERWGEGQGKGWDYLPFNGGPRICLGQQYALTEASYTIVRILQHFSRIEPADPMEEVKMDATLTMASSRVLIKFFK
ncbi:Protein kinase alk2 [Rhizina undulata]